MYIPFSQSVIHNKALFTPSRYRFLVASKLSYSNTSLRSFFVDHSCIHKRCFLSMIIIISLLVKRMKSLMKPTLSEKSFTIMKIGKERLYLLSMKIHPPPSGQSSVQPARIKISPMFVVTPTFSVKQNTISSVYGQGTLVDWNVLSSVRRNHSVPSSLTYLEKRKKDSLMEKKSNVHLLLPSALIVD